MRVGAKYLHTYAFGRSTAGVALVAADSLFAGSWILYNMHTFQTIALESSLGRLNSQVTLYQRSVSWVRASPSAYSYKFVGTFSCAQINGLAESARAWVSNIRWKIDEQWDCWTLCAIKTEGKNRGGEKGRHLWPRLVQKLESKSVRKRKKRKKRKKKNTAGETHHK